MRERERERESERARERGDKPSHPFDISKGLGAADRAYVWAEVVIPALASDMYVGGDPSVSSA